MAAGDLLLQRLFWGAFLPSVGLYAGYRLFGGHFKVAYKKTYAFILARIAVSYNKLTSKRKQRLFADMHDDASTLDRGLRVLEVGAGAGANFRFFPSGTEVVCVDPNPHFDSYLKTNSHEFPHVTLADFVVGEAEDMREVATDSVDAVVCTLVLCTVRDVDQCLTEIKRILRPGGKLYYMEHTSAEKDTWTWTIQRILTPLWVHIGDGCHLTREPWLNIDGAGFSTVDYERFPLEAKKGIRKWLPFLDVISPHLMGKAIK